MISWMRTPLTVVLHISIAVASGGCIATVYEGPPVQQGEASPAETLDWLIEMEAATEAGETERALSIVREAARNDDPVAMAYLGDAYERGQGVRQSYNDAVMWYRLASEQQVASAMNALGELYVEGHGVSRDYEEAFKLFRKAAEQGDIDAGYNLGHLYAMGWGVPRDSSKAIEWLTLSAERGQNAALVQLGSLHWSGHGVQENRDYAIEVWTQAAEAGSADAMLELSRVEWAEQRYSASFEWAQRAAADQSAEGERLLARHYALGLGVAPDEARAKKLLEDAVESDHPEAMYDLGLLLLNPRTIEGDPRRGALLLNRASDLEFAPAMVALGDCYREGKGVTRDLITSAILFSTSARLPPVTF
jgi:TPR repeat protein